jgi:hypothetical protein
VAKNKIADLRDHLFETIEGLKDKDNPMDVKRAQAISSAAQAIIGTAKLEVQYLRLVGADDAKSEFLEPPANGKRLPAPAPPIGKSLGTGTLAAVAASRK